MASRGILSVRLSSRRRPVEGAFASALRQAQDARSGREASFGCLMRPYAITLSQRMTGGGPAFASTIDTGVSKSANNTRRASTRALDTRIDISASLRQFRRRKRSIRNADIAGRLVDGDPKSRRTGRASTMPPSTVVHSESGKKSTDGSKGQQTAKRGLGPLGQLTASGS